MTDIALAIDGNSLNAGDVPLGEQGTVTIEVQNTGSQPIRNLRIAGTCSCVKLPAPILMLHPGATAELPVVFDSGRPSGDFSRRLLASYYYDGQEQSTSVFFKAYTVGDLKIKPRQFVVPSHLAVLEWSLEVRTNGAKTYNSDTLEFTVSHDAINVASLRGSPPLWEVKGTFNVSVWRDRIPPQGYGPEPPLIAFWPSSDSSQKTQVVFHL